MNITINKQAVTISEIKKAKEMQSDYRTWLDDETLRLLALKASNKMMPHWSDLVKVNSIEVTKNHHELTVWAEVITQCHDKFAITSFDVTQANEASDTDAIDNYTRVYKLAN